MGVKSKQEIIDELRDKLEDQFIEETKLEQFAHLGDTKFNVKYVDWLEAKIESQRIELHVWKTGQSGIIKELQSEVERLVLRLEKATNIAMKKGDKVMKLTAEKKVLSDGLVFHQKCSAEKQKELQTEVEDLNKLLDYRSKRIDKLIKNVDSSDNEIDRLKNIYKSIGDLLTQEG